MNYDETAMGSSGLDPESDLIPNETDQAKKAAKEAEAYNEAIVKVAELDPTEPAYFRAIKDICKTFCMPKAPVEKRVAEVIARLNELATPPESDAEPPPRANVERELARVNSLLAVLHEPIGNILVEGGTNGFQTAKLSELLIKYANKPYPPKEGWVKAWLSWESRREFSRVVFEPGAPLIVPEPDQKGPGAYNLWRGWAVKPSPVGTDIGVFWDFLLEVICDGNFESYIWLKKFMAHSVQKPNVMPRKAILLHSDEGAGKGTLWRWYSPLFGQHAFEATSLSVLLGHFNIHLANKLLVSANESLWGGDKRELGQLKGLITDETSAATPKNKDTILVRNYKRWIFSSNADHPVAIGNTSRRFVAFEVSNKRIGDYTYFNELEALRKNGGCAALMRDLLAEDLDGYNPEIAPATGAGLARYKVQSMSDIEKWIHDALQSAEIRRHDRKHDCYEPWGGRVSKNLVYDGYAKTTKSPECQSAFWFKLRKIRLIDDDARSNDKGQRDRKVDLVPIGKARKLFATSMTETVEALWEGKLALEPGECEACIDEAKETAERAARYPR
jgi:hypothetical protein